MRMMLFYFAALWALGAGLSLVYAGNPLGLALLAASALLFWIPFRHARRKRMRHPANPDDHYNGLLRGALLLAAVFVLANAVARLEAVRPGLPLDDGVVLAGVLAACCLGGFMLGVSMKPNFRDGSAEFERDDSRVHKPREQEEGTREGPSA